MSCRTRFYDNRMKPYTMNNAIMKKKRYQQVSRDEMWTSNKLSKAPLRCISIGECWHARTVGGIVGGTTTPGNLTVGSICTAFAAATGTAFKIKSIMIWGSDTVQTIDMAFLRNALTNEVNTVNNALAVTDVGTVQDLAKVRVDIPNQKQKLIAYSTSDTTILVQNNQSSGRFYWRCNLKFQS